MTPAAWAGVYKPLWLAAALLNSGYSYFWDLERDWEIQAFTGPPSGARRQMNSCLNTQVNTVQVLSEYASEYCVGTAPPLLKWSLKADGRASSQHSLTILSVLSK